MKRLTSAGRYSIEPEDNDRVGRIEGTTYGKTGERKTETRDDHTGDRDAHRPRHAKVKEVLDAHG